MSATKEGVGREGGRGGRAGDVWRHLSGSFICVGTEVRQTLPKERKEWQPLTLEKLLHIRVIPDS